MPRIRQKQEQYSREDFMKEIALSKIKQGIKRDSEIATKLGMTAATYSKKKNDPDCFTVSEFRLLIKLLKMDQEKTLKFIGY